jgi:hypothetical protein
MICVATFRNADVPDAFLPFEETGEDMALTYERLVMKRIDLPLYSDAMDGGGGGKVGTGVSDGGLCMCWWCYRPCGHSSRCGELLDSATNMPTQNLTAPD